MKFNSKILLILVVFSLNNYLLQAAEAARDTIIDPNNIYGSAKKLIDERTDIDVKGNFGRTALLDSVYIAGMARRSIDAANRLLKDLPYYISREEMMKNKECNELGRSDAIKAIDLLLANGADLNAIDQDKENAFNYAKDFNDKEVLDILNKFKQLREKKIKDALEQLLISDLTSIVCEY